MIQHSRDRRGHDDPKHYTPQPTGDYHRNPYPHPVGQRPKYGPKRSWYVHLDGSRAATLILLPLTEQGFSEWDGNGCGYRTAMFTSAPCASAD